MDFDSTGPFVGRAEFLLLARRVDGRRVGVRPNLSAERSRSA